jgi:Nif-specific regulatory protein
VLACAAAPDGGRVAGISAPIRLGGHAVGVLHLEVDAQQREATPDDLEFVMAVCDALGLAIDNLAVREVLSSRLARSTDENEQLRRRLGEESRMVGSSVGLQNIVSQIERVAATKATVLIRGESGAGKELVARAIHEASGRRTAPFVCMNCAALSETLLESELFGHEKGAFTGATERKAGKFEAAHKGTLFLDEIGEMSPAIQAKFLRVLEGHPFERVGGSARVQVDVRVVAATSREIDQMVQRGEFRRDLYYRINVVRVDLPPLRTRGDDIGLLAEHFANKAAAEMGRSVGGLSTDVYQVLKGYHWPGNVRELQNVVRRAIAMTRSSMAGIDDLPDDVVSAAGRTATAEAEAVGFFAQRADHVARFEKQFLTDLLARHLGDVSAAAREARLPRGTLYRLMKGHGLDGGQFRK